MVKRRCRLCFRKFVSRRVLERHMRSHTLDQSVSHFLPSGDSEHVFATHNYDEFSVVEPIGSLSLVTPEHRESATELFRKKNHPTRKRRSKRILCIAASSTSIDYRHFNCQQRQYYVRGCGKSSVVDVELDLPISSTTEVTSEEDLAFCLMMMSRDKWNSYVSERSIITTKNKMKYKCVTGGNRASYKRI
ncbi:zinc finger protein ZAT9-like [Chenopodium quinoa]|uniref:zinc finger protein ZAT9-like n=1 Tax=Chenopodium quinoa TaxID=63459 RepID=UPI000B78403A|nr:zinc finger protein ZAT9-like [Chenopodium quinoa]